MIRRFVPIVSWLPRYEKAQLSREQDRWSQLVQAIGRIMSPAATKE